MNAVIIAFGIALAIVAMYAFKNRRKIPAAGKQIVEAIPSYRINNSATTNNFGIGKFWIFVLSCLVTFIATECVHVLGYFSVVGMSTVIIDTSFMMIPISPDGLLWKINFIETFFAMACAIILAISFENQIRYVLIKIQEVVGTRTFWKMPPWVRTGVRYSDVIMITTISFITLYLVCTLAGISYNGSYHMTTEMARSLPIESPAAMWSNLAATIGSFALVFPICWIVIFWMISIEYLLRRELNMLTAITVDIIKTILSNTFDILTIGDSK